MEEFKRFHPIVNFMYFAFVICFSCIFTNPICLFISLMASFTYSAILNGKKAFEKLKYILPLMLITAIANPMFNHGGVTILLYLPSGNPLTLESILYGFCASVMLATVLCWFSCFNEVMTSDKLMYLFGKIIPSLSLVFSMTLRFVPHFISQFKTVAASQKCMGKDISSGGIINRAKSGLTILSAVTTWALENAVEASDSMKARGYGTAKRTAFSIFSFDKRDKKVVMLIFVLGIYTVFGTLFGAFDFAFFPSICYGKISFFKITVFGAYFLLSICPIAIEIGEARRWKALRSKI